MQAMLKRSVAKESTSHALVDVEELQSTSHALIDVEELQRIRLNGTELNRRSPAMCIFEVPKRVKDLDKDAYVPQVVGLGPYHHTATLPFFKELKKEAVLQTLIKIYPADPLDVAMENLRKEVMQMKEDIEDCYEITFPFDPDMFILDSCFLLQFLYPYRQYFNYPSGYDWNDWNGATHFQIQSDLMKLENQIPLILIQRLLHLQRRSDSDDIVIRMASQLFCDYLFDVSYEDILLVLRKIEKKPGHLLEYGQQFVSHFVRDAATVPVNLEDEIWSIPPAQELEKAGIELKCGSTLSFEEKWCGLKGLLTIPALRIRHNSRVGIKNTIAFEESLPFKDRLMIGFAEILDNLIDERADVEVLRRAGIIDHFLESNQAVADLINSTCINVLPAPSLSAAPSLRAVRDRLRVYYKSPWRATIKEFMDTHISKPWVLIGTLAAFFLLVLTIVQTVFTVESYKKGP